MNPSIRDWTRTSIDFSMRQSSDPDEIADGAQLRLTDTPNVKKLVDARESTNLAPQHDNCRRSAGAYAREGFEFLFRGRVQIHQSRSAIRTSTGIATDDGYRVSCQIWGRQLSEPGDIHTLPIEESGGKVHPLDIHIFTDAPSCSDSVRDP
jgi:hypothetical protein